MIHLGTWAGIGQIETLRLTRSISHLTLPFWIGKQAGRVFFISKKQHLMTLTVIGMPRSI
jgi:hypothetical protein